MTLEKLKENAFKFAYEISNWFSDLRSNNNLCYNKQQLLQMEIALPRSTTQQATLSSATTTNSADIVALYQNNQRNNITLTEYFNQWASNAGYESNNSSYMETKRVVDSFAGLCGDKILSAIIKDDIEKFRKHYIESTNLSSNTMNKYLGTIRKLLDDAVNNGYLDTHSIPKGLYKTNVRNQTIDRRPFSNEELQKLFNSAYFTGYKAEREKHVTGMLRADDALYWSPLIALYSGMRIEEIAQLATDDIRQEDGIWFIRITDIKSYQSVKTQSSKRYVPIHRELINLGLLQYYEKQISSQQERLFPELIADNRGILSTNLSKVFGRYNDKIGLDDKNIVFHSFRHTIKDALRNADVDSKLNDSITGHADSSVSGGYGQGYNLKSKHKAIESISYHEIVKHLYRIENPILISPYAPESTQQTIVDVAASAHENWLLLSDAYKLAGKECYGDSFNWLAIKQLSHENSTFIANATIDRERIRLMDNHPAYANESDYINLPDADASICEQSYEIRSYLLKAINNNTKIKLIDADGIEHINKAIPYLKPNSKFKIFYANSKIMVEEAGEKKIYQVFIERSRFDNWINLYGKTWGVI
jgi:integrase